MQTDKTIDHKIYYRDRVTNERKVEATVGEWALRLLYPRNSFLYRLSKLFVLPIFSLSFFSAIYGWTQKRPCSKKKILPFIQKYQINAQDFLKKTEDYPNFTAFFTRALKPEARPFQEDPNQAIIFADGRYLAFNDITPELTLSIKNQELSVAKLIGDPTLAKAYIGGSLVIARLCPYDYHRFHFPFACQASSPKLLNGPLFSVNPIALSKNIHILSDNKRVLTILESDVFSKVLYIEVGATNVGSIIQTFDPKLPQKKGQEKGYFDLGASTIILLFQKGQITLDDDLVKTTLHGEETLCLLGQSLGSKKSTA